MNGKQKLQEGTNVGKVSLELRCQLTSRDFQFGN